MPARDGTGSSGKGSRTGQGMGNCNSIKGNVSHPQSLKITSRLAGVDEYGMQYLLACLIAKVSFVGIEHKNLTI